MCWGADSAAACIVTAQPAAGDLSHWLRTADGAWVGVVTYVATLTDGTTIKCAVRMFLRAASGLHRWQQRLDDRPVLVAGIRRVPLRPVVHPATVDQVGGTVTQARRPFSNTH